MSATPCPSCRQRSRRPGQYLCPACWAALPAPARRALSQRGTKAMSRLQELYEQLTNGVPPHQIQITS